MWQLEVKRNNKGEVIETNQRTYTNATTGSRCTTTMLKQDREGNKWFGFDDLMTIPYTRNFAATKISSLYALGLTKDDLDSHVNTMKTILKKSDDQEKYEKVFAEVLAFESKAKSATDPVKQMSSLVCVYFMLNDEPIDSFDGSLQIRKMSILEADIELHSFFLQRQIELIETYTAHLNLLSAIASLPPNGTLVPSE